MLNANTGSFRNMITDADIMEQVVNYGNYETHTHMLRIFEKLVEEKKTFSYKKFNDCIV